MANMSIENIGGMIRDGNIERIMDRSAQLDGLDRAGPGQAADRLAERAVTAPPGAQEAGSVAPSGSFSELLKSSLDKVNELQNQADAAINELVAGRNKNIHETMLLMERADMSFRLMMQVRNKVIDAYREVMRMQV